MGAGLSAEPPIWSTLGKVPQAGLGVARRGIVGSQVSDYTDRSLSPTPGIMQALVSSDGITRVYLSVFHFWDKS